MELDEGLGDLASKCREDGEHAEAAHPGQDPVLEANLVFVPPRPQWSAPASEVTHPAPGQEGGASEVGGEVSLADPKLGPHAPPDLFLTSEGQGEVDTIERHPVNVPLPVRPLPPHEAVARGADILIISGDKSQTSAEVRHDQPQTHLNRSAAVRLMLAAGSWGGRASWSVSQDT